MSGAALALALGAALLHATWNVVLAGSRDSVVTAGALQVWGVVLLGLAALAFGGVSAGAVPFIAASGVLQLVYFVLLARAYSGGDLGRVYPVARGSAPVIVLLIGAGALGEEPDPVAIAGVLLVAGGVLMLAAGQVGRRDVLSGLAIGVAIAGYTLVDSEGLEHADPLAYLFLATIIVCVAYNAALLASGRGQELKRAALARTTPITAAATFGAYALVLAALERAPAAPVAAVRESSVVIAAVMAWVLLKEPLRLAPALLVAAGVAAIALA